jgi:hypothetical protein
MKTLTTNASNSASIGEFEALTGLRSIYGLCALALCVALSACGEVDQKVKSDKIYAGKKDTRAYEGEKFANDQKKWEATLAARSKTQNEYLRTDSK